MLVTQSDMIKDVKRKLDASGVDITYSVIRLVIETEHELIRENLIQNNEISIADCFSAKAKLRAYRDPAGRGRQYTAKIDASIDSGLRSEILFKNNSINDVN